jgi:hypothetical protein
MNELTVKVYQIYFKEEQEQILDPAFAPLFNHESVGRGRNQELREWVVWNDHYDTMDAPSESDVWGFVSWKFAEKTGVRGEDFVKWIKDNPDNDVWIINPCILNEAVFANGWEQGAIHHPGIVELGNDFLRRIGMGDDVSVVDELIDSNYTTYANYVVGNRKFWASFMEFSRMLFAEAAKDPVFADRVFGPNHSNYGPDPTLPMFTFLIERLLPSFLVSSDFRVASYRGHYDRPLPKYRDVIEDIRALTTLKSAVIETGDDELFSAWRHFRTRFLMSRPGVLGLE